jgi:hypothetical protein
MVKSLSCTVAVCLLTASAASADVQLAMNNGRVSIVAKDATVRQILTEWARVGQTKVVNVERIPGGPLTLELTNMPEGQALDVLLTSVSGYVAAPRQTPVAGLSVFDRIIVMPTVAAPRQAAAAPPPTTTFQAPQFVPPPPVDDDPDDVPVPNVQMPGQPRAPVFNTFPPPQVGGPQNLPPGMQSVVPAGRTDAPVTFGSTPTAPAAGGVAVPGMIVQPPPPIPSPGLSPSQTPPQVAPVPGQIQRPGGRGGAASR